MSPHDPQKNSPNFKDTIVPLTWALHAFVVVRVDAYFLVILVIEGVGAAVECF